MSPLSPHVTGTFPANPSAVLGAHSDLASLLQRIEALEARMVALERVLAITGAGVTLTCPGDLRLTVGGSLTTTVGLNQVTNVGANQTMNVGRTATWTFGVGLALQAAKTFALTTGDAITLTTGASSASMKKDGSLALQGKDLTLDGSGRIVVKAASDLTLKGARILEN